ncbi:response regulator [Methylocapsa polymorpha]|uniref:histidine kinase n=1 Tax=Methylocapsa polymorpha TaxID=3080828 RepID=A0ABZ0HWD9_9HYPH|nr:response regulator [Methylocapsa sp. RX1]
MPTAGTSSNYLVDHSSLRASHGLDDSVFDDVRAVGGRLTARVPELIKDFYGWLSGLPEFGRFLSNEQLLARVKGQQAEYWKDFLRAEVDEAYVERRRVVGQAHARIELGLLIYLQAMEFVSAWLRREIEADQSLRDRPMATLSIRKLIEFDSAIVVDTYGARTARSLEEQRRRLEHVAGVMRAVTEGDLSPRIDVTGPEDVLGTSLNEMVQSLRNIAREMGLIARGNYSAHVPPRSEKDELGISLQAMTLALREAAEKNEQHIWLSKTQTELGQAMSGNPSVRELSQRVLSHLCRALDVQVGAQYILDDGSGTLRLAGAYAIAEGKGARERWKLGEGLVGQAAQEKRRILVNDVPEDSIRIHWGLGEALPKSLVVLPLVHEGEARGVIELGSLGRFSRAQLDLLDYASSSVGLAISAAETRARVQQLLEESQAQGEELTTQQEELRQVNDTLEEHMRALESQKESLLATETVLRQKAAELERTSRYKSEFLANMSHELRTPLNSSLILAKLLSDNKEGNLSPEQVKYAQSISAAGNDLLTLINDILDLSKIEAGKIDLNIEPVAVSRLVSNLKHRFELLASERKLEFCVAVDPSCPQTIDTDPQRLQQILSNLLSNAVKFTEKGTVRLLAAPKDSRRIAFTVEDTGIGIPVEQQDIIFEAFRQADGTTNRKFGGTGLGLSISRELAGLLGGQIRVRSAAGEGSAFTLLIPHQAQAEAMVAALPSSAPRTEAGRHQPAEAARPFVEDDRDLITDPARAVLVIEDDPVFAEILRDLARELGFQCITAGTAETGLRLAREYRPEAVLLDIGLPDQSGLTVLELLKRDPSTRHAPIHVVSVHDYQQVAREMGAVGYMLKPVKREQLVSAFRLLEERFSRKAKAILIVEDEGVQRSALTKLLASDDVDIVAVATAEEALRQIRGATFDCVVLDLMLPDVSGFELLDRMSRDESCALPPVIVYTARSLTVDEEQKLRRLSKSIIVKGARSPERLLEEVTLFLHQVESKLPPEKQWMLRVVRDREAILDGRRVLLVEDDVRNIFSLTAVLEREGVVVDIARNGKEALVRLDRAPSVDVVLMDIMMPEMDGFEATREIRKRNGLASLPVIALTAKAMADDRQQCLAAGANDYIAKPIDVEKLLSLIRVWMPK